MNKLSIAVFGAAGRMGQAIIDIIKDDANTQLGAVIERDDHPALGQTLFDDTSVLRCVAESDLSNCETMIAFPTAEGVTSAIDCATNNNLALVMGTTGLNDEQQEQIKLASVKTPVLWAANMSLGICVLSRLLEQAVHQLAQWDIEILEFHHRGKLDTPSGTALHLGKVVRAAKQQEIPFNLDRSKKRQPRGNDEIGMAAMRGGDIVGEHTVYLTGTGERLELTHRALSRHTFAYGAVHAAKLLVGKPAGLYLLDDILPNH